VSLEVLPLPSLNISFNKNVYYRTFFPDYSSTSIYSPYGYNPSYDTSNGYPTAFPYLPPNSYQPGTSYLPGSPYLTGNPYLSGSPYLPGSPYTTEKSYTPDSSTPKPPKYIPTFYTAYPNYNSPNAGKN